MGEYTKIAVNCWTCTMYGCKKKKKTCSSENNYYCWEPSNLPAWKIGPNDAFDLLRCEKNELNGIKYNLTCAPRHSIENSGEEKRNEWRWWLFIGGGHATANFATRKEALKIIKSKPKGDFYNIQRFKGGFNSGDEYSTF